MLDDQGDEILFGEDSEKEKKELTQKEIFQMIYQMRLRLEELPQEALLAPLNHNDLISLLILLSAILNAKQ
jgi:hypothetical protein